MKNKYLEFVNNNFENSAKDILEKHIDLFYSDIDIKKNKYNIGDDVFLKKGTFIHGIRYSEEVFNFIIDNGFIASDFSNIDSKSKYPFTIGMWNLKKDYYLKDYIYDYSGTTLEYDIGRGPSSKKIAKLIPYKCFEDEIEIINNDNDIWMWRAEQTKEIRFLPSLASNKIQIAFILNTESDYAKQLIKDDIFNPEHDKSILKSFIVEPFLDKFINSEKNALFTDRESAIMFGLPSSLIEGILVGKDFEKDIEKLDFIKSKLPNCYICNLDGKVIR